MMRVSAAGVLARFERFAPTGAQRRSSALLALYTIGLFLIFLVFTFPHDLQARQWLASIEKRSGWKIEPEGVTFVPWEGYRLSRVRITPPRTSDPAWLEADRLALRPRLTDLLLPGRTRAFVFAAQAYDGELSGTFSTGEPSTIEIEIDDVSLASAEALRRLVDGDWTGRLSGRFRVDAGADVRTLSGEGDLEITNASLRGGIVSGFKVPDLTFDRGDANVKIEEGRVEVRKLTLGGEQVDVDARGDLFLRAPFAQSVLNLTLGVRPVPGAAPDLENLLLLWNRNQPPVAGAYALTLVGSVGRPRLR